jgi:hypothetical protein
MRSCAPASSMTSMALSGSRRSLTYLAESFTAASMASSSYLHLVVRLVLRLQPLQDLHRVLERGLAHVDALEAPRQRAVALERGSCTPGRWSTRCSAACPEASAGLSRFDASIEPPMVAPAPTMVWISSMKRIASGLLQRLEHRLQALFELPAKLGAREQRAHVEGVHLGPSSTAGTVASKMAFARPSAMAVLPTPGVAHVEGLFFRRRHSTWMVRSSSGARPMSGSMWPSAACGVEVCAVLRRAGPSPEGPRRPHLRRRRPAAGGFALLGAQSTRAARGHRSLPMPCET